MRTIFSSLFIVISSTALASSAFAQEIVQVEPPAASPPSAPSVTEQPAPSAPSVPSAQSAQSAPIVQLNSPEPMSLETHDGPGAPWRTVCTSPCNMRLPTSSEYRLTGEGLKPSAPFRIDPMQRDQIQLRIDPGSKGSFSGGIALIIVGAVAMVGGSTYAIWNNGPYSYEGSKDVNKSRLLIGTVIALAGVGLATGGVVMLVKNASTKVYDGDQRLVIRKPKREAEWRTPTAQEVATPGVWSLPVLQGSF